MVAKGPGLWKGGLSTSSCQHWLLLLRKGTVDSHLGHDFNVCIDYSMRTHTGSRGAKAQELGRLQSTTLDQYIYRTLKILTKGAILVLLTFLLFNLAWDKGRGKFILLVPFPQFTTIRRDGRALGLVLFPFTKRASSSVEIRKWRSPEVSFQLRKGTEQNPVASFGSCSLAY